VGWTTGLDGTTGAAADDVVENNHSSRAVRSAGTYRIVGRCHIIVHRHSLASGNGTIGAKDAE
jgi:hypothetical protein